MDSAAEIGPGRVVRLKHDPARVGTITQRSKEYDGETHWQVQFATGFQYVRESQLERAETARDPQDLLADGTLSPASDLRRVLTHARLSGRLADVIYSLGTTRTDFYPHQFKPVLKMLSSVSNGVLIADEVGLGKTIEAGLIWTELRTRFDYQRLFVMCPAVLRDKWRRELQTRFGVRAELCDAEQAYERLQQASKDRANEPFALVGSLQGLRPRGEEWGLTSGPLSPSQKLAKLLAEHAEEEPLVDLLVIDEAHHLRNTGTANSLIGRLLRGVSAHTALLTATPVNLASNDLYSLMRLLDEDTFASIGEFDDILRANGPLVAAREAVLRIGASRESILQQLHEAVKHPILKGSKTLAWMIENFPSESELASHGVRAALAYQLEQANLLGQLINRTRKREVQENRIQRRAVPQAVTLTALEAEFYERVTNVVREYCRRQGASEGFLLTMPQRQMASSIPAAFRYWKDRIDQQHSAATADLEDEDDLDAEQDRPDAQLSEMGNLVRELYMRVRGLGDFESLREADSKYALLVRSLREHVADNPRAKIVLFSSFRATLSYLDQRLREDSVRTMIMTGDTEDKDATIEEFQGRDEATVLLSSEVGSEGVDLQFARVVINYDLPWNPMRVEQRIGRLDRLGQEAKVVLIWNLFCAQTIDERIYDRLYTRIGIFEHALGSVEPILGQAVQELTSELMRDQLTPDEEAELIDAATLAIENVVKIEADLEDNAGHLFALGDYLLEQVHAARELGRRITDLDLRNYVVEFLRRFDPASRVTAIGADPCQCNIRLGTATKAGLEAFMLKMRVNHRTRLISAGSSGLNCVFRNLAGDGERSSIETINQFHPLVRYARERLKEEESDLQLAIAAEISTEMAQGKVPEGRYVFSVERWSVSGVQETERLAYEARELESNQALDPDQAERLVHAAASEGSDWLSAASDIDVSRVATGEAVECLRALEARFETHVRTVKLQNHDRAEALLRTLERQVAGQVARLEETARRHQLHGRDSLAAATLGKIERLKERAEIRRHKIQSSAEVITHRALFLMGLIQVA